MFHSLNLLIKIPNNMGIFYLSFFLWYYSYQKKRRDDLKVKNYSLELENGKKIELTPEEMMKISAYYKLQGLADYIRENHPRWTEEKVQIIAYEAKSDIDEYGYEESDAINEASEQYNRPSETDFYIIKEWNGTQKQLEDAWRALSDVVTEELEDDSIALAEDWFIFEKGTDKEEGLWA